MGFIVSRVGFQVRLLDRGLRRVCLGARGGREMLMRKGRGDHNARASVDECTFNFFQ